MAYMLQKAKAHGINFDLSVSGSVKYLVENVIGESDLNTLLADLIDNAIIAVKNCEKKISCRLSASAIILLHRYL